MKKIHLYDINRPDDCEKLTGRLLNPVELASGEYQIPKEDFSGTAVHLQGYDGKWHIEVTRDRKSAKTDSPFDIAVYYIGPYGCWAIPARVYLVLEDFKE